MLKIYLALETDLISRGCCVKWGGHGYSLQWDTLNSKDYGVPQNRERVFIVCYLGNICGREVFPIRPADGENPCELNEITQGVADAQRIYDGSGLARTLKGESGGQGGKTGLYAVRFRYTERGEKSREKGRMEPIEFANALTSKHCGDQTADCSNGVVCMSIRGQKLQKQIDVAPTIDTGCRDNLTRKQTCCAVLTPDRGEKRQNGRRIKEPGEPSFTLTAQDRHGVALLDGNIRVRRLTPRECWRLQGFPDEYFDKARAAGISDTQLYKQAGNGVTVNVARAIGERLKEVEEHDE
ncbi:DNA cytosine methyltransferase [Phascolarctobacterium succinatutens]